MDSELISRNLQCPKCKQFKFKVTESSPYYITCGQCDRNWELRGFLVSQLHMSHADISNIFEDRNTYQILQKHKRLQDAHSRLYNSWDDDSEIINELKTKLIEPNKIIVKYKLGLDENDKLVMPLINPANNSFKEIIPLEDIQDASLILMSTTALNQGIMVSRNIYNAFNLISLGYQSVVYIKNLYSDFIEGFQHNIQLYDTEYIPKEKLKDVVLKRLEDYSEPIVKNLKKRIPPTSNIVISRPLLKKIYEYTGDGSKNLLQFYLYILINGNKFNKDYTLKHLNISPSTFDNMITALNDLNHNTNPLYATISLNILGIYYFNQSSTRKLHQINFRILNIITDIDALKVYIYLHYINRGHSAYYKTLRTITRFSVPKLKKAIKYLIDLKYIKFNGTTYKLNTQKIPYT